jgi:hypothetical protein
MRTVSSAADAGQDMQIEAKLMAASVRVTMPDMATSRILAMFFLQHPRSLIIPA